MQRNDIVRVLLELSRQIKARDGDQGEPGIVCTALVEAAELIMRVPLGSEEDDKLLARLATMRDKQKAGAEASPEVLAVFDALAPGLKGMKRHMVKRNREGYEVLSAVYNRLSELTGKGNAG